MAKVPTNKVKKAVKVAYLGQKPLLKILFKQNLPVWTKASEAEREALLKVGAAVWANPNTNATEAVDILRAEVPAPEAGGLVATLVNPDLAFALDTYLFTVKFVLGYLS